MYKTETHLHTAETSLCGVLTAKEVVELYHEAGYKTLFVTDHFHKNYFNKLGEGSWDEKFQTFLSGYKAAKAEGEKYGMNIILAAEITFTTAPNDYILIGATEEFLYSCEDKFEWGIEKFYPYAKQHGVTVIQAHPYRDNMCFPTPEFVDAIEAYNTNPRHENYDKKACELAAKYNKPVTAGSDAHRDTDVALSAVLSEEEIKTGDDYLRLLFEGKLEFLH